MYRWVVLRTIFELTTVSRPGGGFDFVQDDSLQHYQLLNGIAFLSFVMLTLLVFFVGGLMVAREEPLAPGLNGAATSIITAAVFLICLLGSILLWALAAWTDPPTLNARLGDLAFFTATSCSILPFAIISGYLGGQVRRRLDNRVGQLSR